MTISKNVGQVSGRAFLGAALFTLLGGRLAPWGHAPILQSRKPRCL